MAAGGARSFVEVAADRQVLTVSLGTLQGIGAEELRRKLGDLSEAFAFVKFGDNPRARARVSPWAAAAVALDVGVEPIVHAGCRDRNRLALQSDLLGGRLLGVRNVLCLRGDEMEASDQPEARAVRDLDVTELIRTAAGHFCVLAAADPAAGMSEGLAARLREKVAAGAQVLETQPMFDLDGFGTWRAWLSESGVDVPLLVDVAVVTTVAEAELLERIPYVAAPPDLAAWMRRDPGAGVVRAAELIAGLLELDGVAGCHVSLLGGDPAAGLSVVERL